MSQNAIALLKEDHDKVRDLLEQLSNTTARARKTRKDLLEKIATELDVHTTIEEEIFYPAFKEAGGSDSKEMFHEALEEHRAVEKLILPDLKKTVPDSETFSGRAKVLKELVEHHADEEEEEMFKQAKKLFSKDELDELGERMQIRKKELESKLKAA